MAEPEGRRAGPTIPMSWAWDVLLSCARSTVHASRGGPAETLGAGSRVDPIPEADPVDWDQLLDLADRHGMSAFLQRYLAAADGADVPAPVERRLRDRVHLRTRENLRQLGALVTLAPAFADEGIDVLAFKGPVLSRQLYGSPTLRDYDDIDLLVRERDVGSAMRLLAARGLEPWIDVEPDQERRLPASQYARHFGDPRTGVAVDLHWGFAKPYLSFRIAEADLWERTQEVAVGGAILRTLSDPLLLLVLCVHGSKHEPFPWNRLEWIVDVAALAERLPPEAWAPLARRVEELRLERPFLFGLLVAHRLLGTPLAPAVAERLEHAADLERLTRVALTTLVEDGGARARDTERIDWDLRLLDRWQDRGRYVLHRLFVPNPKDWAAVRLPWWLAPAYWVLRPFRLGGAAVARLRGGWGEAERRA